MCDRLHNTEREDIVFIAFQIWLLGVSVIALLHESIPHILVSLVTHVMATAWGGFQIAHTANFRKDFNQVIAQGACKGTVLLPNYWEARAKAEIPSLVFNTLALIVSGILTWRLMKVRIRFLLCPLLNPDRPDIRLANFQTSWCFTHYQPSL